MFHDNQVHYFDKTESFDNISSFIHHVTHPSIMELGNSFENAYTKNPSNFFVLMVKTLDDPLANVFENFAKNHKK